MPESIRVVLVEDHDLVADAIEIALTSVVDIELVARARSVRSAIEVVLASQPAVIVLDRRLPDGDGIEAIARLREVAPTARVLVITGAATAVVAARVAEAGAAGLVLKSARLDDLVAAIRRIFHGEAIFSQELLGVAFGRATLLGGNLTARELEMLPLLADGATVEEIAGQLHLARNTVRNHVQRILSKLGAHSQLEAVAIARRAGLLD